VSRRTGPGRSPSAGGSAAERAARAEDQRRRFVRAAYLVLFAGLTGLLLGILASDLFAIRRVQVRCEHPSLQAEAAERARRLSFATIWLPPTRAIERQIGGLPRARSVAIARELPSTLIIVVEPREPVAAVSVEGRFMAIDEEGVCLHWTGDPASALPTVHLEDPLGLEVGDRLSDDDVRRFQAVLSALISENLQAGASIDLSHPLRISVFTADGVLGKLGNEELLHEKTLLFGELLASLRADGREPLSIDLRVPSRPSYRPVN